VTSDQIDVIVEMYKDEQSYSKIAKVVGLSEHVVKHWVRNNRSEYGLPKRRNRADKTGVISESAWLDNKWNIKRGVEYIMRRWGSA